MSDTYHICYLRGVFLCFKAISRPMWIDRLSFWIWNLGSSIRCFFQSNIRMKLLWILEQRLAGWKRIYPSKRGRITGIMHWLVAIAFFSFLLCLNFLILFFFFFSFYLQCWCILCRVHSQHIHIWWSWRSPLWLDLEVGILVLYLFHGRIFTPNKNKSK